MSLKTQAKVLRALQEQVVEPVGGAASVRVDVRVLAATNKDLPTEIRGGALPRGPLLPAERHSDLRAAAARPRRRHPAAGRALHGGARARVRAAAARRSTPARADRRCSATAGRATCASCATCIERLMIMVPGDTIAPADLSFLDGGRARSRSRRRTSSMPLHEARDRFERDYILQRARGAAGQHLAHRRRARRRAQQPLSQDARASASRRRGASTRRKRRSEVR